MPKIAPNTPNTPGEPPRFPRTGAWPVLGLLVLLAIVVVVTTRSTDGVKTAVDPLMPIAWFLLGRRSGRIDNPLS